MSASKGKKARIGALVLISTLMISSAVLRLVFEAGPALAREASDIASHRTPTAEGESPRPSLAPEDMAGLLKAFRDREDALQHREMEIEDRMKALSIADAALERRLAALIEAEENLRATLALADGAAERDLAGLTSVYEKMKPKETAALFEEMAPQFAAGFLSRMRPEIAAGVMAGLSPQAAYSISVILAGRNTSVPTE